MACEPEPCTSTPTYSIRLYVKEKLVAKTVGPAGKSTCMYKQVWPLAALASLCTAHRGFPTARKLATVIAYIHYLSLPNIDLSPVIAEREHRLVLFAGKIISIDLV